MKRIISALLISAVIITLILSFGACAKKDKGDDSIPDGMKLASNPEYTDYNLYVPEEWQITVSTALTVAEAISSDHSSVSVCAYTNTSIPASENIISEYWKLNEESLIAMFDTEKGENGKSETTYSLVESEKITLKANDANIAAEKYTYTASLAGTSLEYVQVVAYHDAYFFIMTFTTTPERFSANSDTFDKIIANFQLIK